MPDHPALPPVFFCPRYVATSTALVFEAVCSQTALGDVVRVVGSDDVLGCWDPARGIQLHTAATSFPHWTGNILVPRSGPQIEWKLVITRADGTTEWEPAGNRHTKLEPSPEGGPRLVRVHWGSACREPEPCLSPKHSIHPATLQFLDQAAHEGVKALGEPGTPSTEAEAAVVFPVPGLTEGGLVPEAAPLGEPGTPSTEAEAAVFPMPELTEGGLVPEAAPEDVPEAVTWEPTEGHEFNIEKARQVPEACSIRVRQKGVGFGAHRTLHFTEEVPGEVSGRTGALNASVCKVAAQRPFRMGVTFVPPFFCCAPCLPIAGCTAFSHSN